MHADDRQARQSEGLLGVTGKGVDGRPDESDILKPGTVVVQQQLICTSDNTWQLNLHVEFMMGFDASCPSSTASAMLKALRRTTSTAKPACSGHTAGSKSISWKIPPCGVCDARVENL